MRLRQQLKSALAVVAACAGTPLVSAAQTKSAIVVGRVFDSLRMTPLSRVRITLEGTTYQTSTDSNGVYRLVVDVRGRRTLTFSEPRLVRLIGLITSEVDLEPGSVSQFDFAIPRVPPSPFTICLTDGPTRDSKGAIVGVVRDSSTGLPISGALIASYWAKDTLETQGVRVESDEDGGFLICGLPVDRPVSLLARSPGREASQEGLRPTSRAILDIDLFGRPSADGAETGHLRGRVLDSTTSAPLSEAEILAVESGLRATSGPAGAFAIDRLVSGRVALVARRIGYRPKFVEAVISPRSTTTVDVVLSRAPVRLEEVESRVVDLDRDFVERQRHGLGKYWVETDIRRFDGGSMSALLGTKANLREQGGVLLNYSRGRNCRVPVVLDGVLFPVANVRPEQLARAEYYSGVAQVPNDFQSFHLRAGGFGCGLLVLWSRGR